MFSIGIPMIFVKVIPSKVNGMDSLHSAGVVHKIFATYHICTKAWLRVTYSNLPHRLTMRDHFRPGSADRKKL